MTAQNLPHFLVIGAAKSGTVSLYNYLRQHPDIFMAPVNESCFFALDGADLSDWFHGPGDRATLAAHAIDSLDDYLALFSAARPNQLRGEASPLYLYSPHAPGRIHHYNPTTKLIALLRHPADRAFSNYSHYRQAGLEPLDTFDAALAAESERIAAGWGPWPFWHYRQVGRYGEQLHRYYNRFPADQILVLLHDDLRADPLATMRRIYTFLGVDPDFEPNTAVVHNISAHPKNRTLYRLMTRPNRAKSIFNALVPSLLRRPLRDAVHRRNSTPPTFDPSLRAQLTADYSADIHHLQSLIGRDLAHWLQGQPSHSTKVK